MSDVVAQIPRSNEENVNAIDLCNFLDLFMVDENESASSVVLLQKICLTYHVQCLLGLNLHDGQKMIVGILHVIKPRKIAFDVESSHGKWTPKSSLSDRRELGTLDQPHRVLDGVQ